LRKTIADSLAKQACRIFVGDNRTPLTKRSIARQQADLIHHILTNKDGIAKSFAADFDFF
jgi:hypothetical protein